MCFFAVFGFLLLLVRHLLLEAMHLFLVASLVSAVSFQVGVWKTTMASWEHHTEDMSRPQTPQTETKPKLRCPGMPMRPTSKRPIGRTDAMRRTRASLLRTEQVTTSVALVTNSFLLLLVRHLLLLVKCSYLSSISSAYVAVVFVQEALKWHPDKNPDNKAPASRVEDRGSFR